MRLFGKYNERRKPGSQPPRLLAPPPRLSSWWPFSFIPGSDALADGELVLAVKCHSVLCLRGGALRGSIFIIAARSQYIVIRRHNGSSPGSY